MGQIATFVEITGEKLVGGAFLVPSILNRVNVFQFQNSNCGFLTDFELCQSGWSILETLNIVKRKIHFSYYRDCSNILVIFLDFINKFYRLLLFFASREQVMRFWLMSRRLTLGGMWNCYLPIWYIIWYPLIFCSFFQMVLLSLKLLFCKVAFLNMYICFIFGNFYKDYTTEPQI